MSSRFSKKCSSNAGSRWSSTPRPIEPTLDDQEAFEIDLIQAYMPEELSSDEVDRLIDEAVAASGAQSMKDMGKVMGSLKPAAQRPAPTCAR